MTFLRRWQLSSSPRPVSVHSTSSLKCSQTCWPQPSCILSNISNTISHPWLSGCTRNQFVTNSGWWLHYPKATRGREYKIIFVKSGNWIQRDNNCTDWSLLKIFRTGFSKFRVCSLSLWKTGMSNIHNSQVGTAAKTKRLKWKQKIHTLTHTGEIRHK